jgi:hypothetical protein
MILNTIVEQISFALLGGIAAELLHWYGLSRKAEGVTAYSKHLVYWITTAGMIALGAIMPLLYIEGSASALLCFHLGAATPVIVQKLISIAPAPVVSQGQRDTTMRDFFTW